MDNVFVTGSFDDLRTEQVRFLEAASRYGNLHVLLWPDEAIEAQQGHPPKFGHVERQYILQAIRFVSRVIVPRSIDDPEALPHQGEMEPHLWVVDKASNRHGDCRSQLEDLCVAVGHDANIRLLKGEGHPLFPQGQRRYLVQAVRSVKHALITSGDGWMDAEPEIELLHPDIYSVNIVSLFFTGGGSQ